MSFEKAKKFLDEKGFGDRVSEFHVSSATVALAASAVGCETSHIAKSLSFKVGDKAIIIVTAGDKRINNRKFKLAFGSKAKMLNSDEVESLIGHSIGGVCPFGINSGVKVYIDVSLKRFDYIYPACGSSNSAVRLSPDELKKIVENSEWVDVCGE
ncbi:MAG: YbaK/EbsC family protein [Clostridiales bacterium]|nr:YbaK/EbsC family protein [Clostridiales bacterium]